MVVDGGRRVVIVVLVEDGLFGKFVEIEVIGG